MQASAAISDGNGNFHIDSIDVQSPQRGEVLVRVKAAGLCHTDWDSLRWGRPLILGHEGAGIVEAVGEGVTRTALGDAVLLNWALPCGECFQCVRGVPSICENRRFVPPARSLYRGQGLERSFGLGTMSTYTVVAQEGVVPIRVNIPFPSAAIIGCGVMTGYGSVVNSARVTARDSVVVLGCGGVGLNVIQGARISGAYPIIAVDLQTQRLEMARQFGATHTVQSRADDPDLRATAAQVREILGGRGADFCFECTAIPALGAAPLVMVRNGGCALQLSGIEQPISFDMELFEWNKTYLNPLYGGCRPDIDFPAIFSLYERGLLKLDEMVTTTYPLTDLARAFEDLQRGVNAKGVLVMD